MKVPLYKFTPTLQINCGRKTEEKPFKCLELLEFPAISRPEVRAPEIIEVFQGELPRFSNYIRQVSKRTKKERPIKKRTKKTRKTTSSIGNRNYQVIEVPRGRGKKPKVDKRWHLLCAHCEELFYARPTPKNSRYVVNHQCKSSPGIHRRQFIIGVKGKNCCLPHKQPCIQHVKCF